MDDMANMTREFLEAAEFWASRGDRELAQTMREAAGAAQRLAAKRAKEASEAPLDVGQTHLTLDRPEKPWQAESSQPIEPDTQEYPQ